MALACLSVLLALFSLACSVFGQSGFVSIDCGVSSGYSYIDTTTKITYVSDDQYTDAGVNSKIANSYINSVSTQDQTVRSFPTGLRNCYTLNVTEGNKYLLRAIFMHGKYDGQSLQNNKPLLFDLHLGVNKWDSIKIYDSSTEYIREAITIAEANILSVCLVNIGKGSPFISALEMRPLDNTLYPKSTTGTSISFLYRFNYGATTNEIIRYPDDLLDRIWTPYPNSSSSWKDLSVPATTTLTRLSSDSYQAPDAIYQTAVTPTNSPNITVLQWAPENASISYYNNFYTCELRKPSSNDSTQFAVYLNGDVWLDYTHNSYLNAYYMYTLTAGALDQFEFVFSAFANSTLPPVVNGAEIFLLFDHTIPMTDPGDANAIYDIKVQYGLKKNWMGDPCNPDQYVWDGLKCSYPTTGQPTIVSLNLSSSRLTGVISDSFNQFQAIKNLDLSCNNLSGAIPDFLGSISTLKTLDLRGNNFIGSVPDTLQKKNNSGLLELLTGPGQCLPSYSSSPSSSSKKTTIIAIAIAIPVSLIIIVILIVLFLKRCKQGNDQVSVQTSQQDPPHLTPPVQSEFKEPILNNAEIRSYTYKQIVQITSNFSQAVGEGGFGQVYYGLLENSKEVAVKLSSQAALKHVAKQFLAEANNLTKVHHISLVSLVGYCRDGNYVALIYEFMPNGSLHDHLRGKPRIARHLSWGERVRIALEAAQGLHYLHPGCNMIHRDVKSSNILLGRKLEAKVADFGLSKISSSASTTQSNTSPGKPREFDPTTLCGTPGYMDPEANMTQRLNAMSDVYSFGVVLLEIITGEPPIIIIGRENIHIIEYVKQKLHGGNIDEVADPRFRGEYNQNSIWKIVDLAMHCTARSASQRPTMADVVKQLQDSLEFENKPRNKAFRVESTNTSQTSGSFSTYGPLPR